MSKLLTLARSTVGQKWITGITGLALVLFLIAHLVGNLTMFIGAEAFNTYAYFLEHLGHGKLLIVAEVFLLVFVLSHAWIGVKIYLQRRKARPNRYQVSGDAGGASKKTKASLNMLLSGLVLLVFIPVHVNHFKFGEAVLLPHPNKMNAEMRDVYTLVIEAFQQPGWTLFYVACMAVLGTHLMHGIWSAIHSVGATRPQTLKGLVVGGRVFGWLLAIGFLILPVLILLGLVGPETAEVVAEVH